MAQEKAWIDNRDLYIIKEYPVSPDNKLSIKKFFEDNKYYNKDELAKAARRSSVTINKWARKTIREKQKQFAKRKTQQQKQELPSITDQAIWDNRDWFYQKYIVEKYGIVAISRIIGRKQLIVNRRLKKYNIETRKENNKSPSPYCNEEWLMKHYATPADYMRWCKQNKKEIDPNGGTCLSIRACAKIANVGIYTIYNWLIRFNIPIRDRHEAYVFHYRKKHGLLKKPSAQ